MADDLRHTLVVLSDALAMGRAHCSSLQIARACIAEGKAQGEEAEMLCSVIANSLRFHREQYSNWQVLARRCRLHTCTLHARRRCSSTRPCPTHKPPHGAAGSAENHARGATRPSLSHRQPSTTQHPTPGAGAAAGALASSTGTSCVFFHGCLPFFGRFAFP